MRGSLTGRIHSLFDWLETIRLAQRLQDGRQGFLRLLGQIGPLAGLLQDFNDGVRFSPPSLLNEVVQQFAYHCQNFVKQHGRVLAEQDARDANP